jgi:hypothetical protein
MSAEVVFYLDVILTIDDAEIKNTKDLTVSLEKAEVAGSDCGNTRWRATGGTPKSPLIDFMLLGRLGDTSFGMWQALCGSGAPRGVGISDAGRYPSGTCSSTVVSTSSIAGTACGMKLTHGPPRIATE